MELLRQYGVASWVAFPLTDVNGDVVSGIPVGEIDEQRMAWNDTQQPSVPLGDFDACSNAALEVGSTGVYELKLDAAELQADLVYVKIRNSGTQGAKTQHILIRTMVGNPSLLATTTAGGLAALADGVDVTKWHGDAVPAPNDAGVPVVDVTSIDGELLAGNNANLKLKTLNITNSAGTAVTIASTGSNGTGVSVTGHGTADAVTIVGGATAGSGIDITGGDGAGTGLKITGGSSNGTAMSLQGDGTGEGLISTGGETGNGIEAVGGSTSGSGIKATGGKTGGHGIEAIGDVTAATTGDGIRATGSPAGNGIRAVGGSESGSGIEAVASAGDGHGIEAAGFGTGAGLITTGGTNGPGLEAKGGATSGPGLYAHAATSGNGITALGTTNGHGLDCDGTGTGEGISATGGAEGEGIECIGGATSGAGFRAAATANNDAGMELVKHGTGKDIDSTETDYIGIPVAVDGSDLTLAAILLKICDDNGGQTFDATTDSLVELHDDHITFITAAPLTAAEVEAECVDALESFNLDHLLAVDTGVGIDADLAAIVVDGSVMAHLMTSDLDTAGYACTTDSLEAIRDNMAGADAPAIAAAVWDELTADITQAGSIGVFLKGLSSTAGAGAITFTYTVYDVADGTTPIADVDVWITSDVGGTTIIASGKSDAYGKVVAYLDAGTIYVWRQKTGWNFTNPDTETVA